MSFCSSSLRNPTNFSEKSNKFQGISKIFHQEIQQILRSYPTNLTEKSKNLKMKKVCVLLLIFTLSLGGEPKSHHGRSKKPKVALSLDHQKDAAGRQPKQVKTQNKRNKKPWAKNKKQKQTKNPGRSKKTKGRYPKTAAGRPSKTKVTLVKHKDKLWKIETWKNQNKELSKQKDYQNNDNSGEGIIFLDTMDVSQWVSE